MTVLVISAVLGAAVGSFLNVVIHRLPKPDLSVASPRRSFCPKCKTQIAWYDNIPIVSYFALLGRCRACRTPIPLRYLVVELFTAALFALCALVRLPPGAPLLPAVLPALAIDFLLVAAAVAITCIDWDEKIIPDEITLPGCVLLPFLSALAPQTRAFQATHQMLLAIVSPRLAAYLNSTLGALVGLVTLFLLVVVFGRLIPLYWRGLRSARRALGRTASNEPIPARVEAMGLGDVKYLALIGAALGPEGALLCFGLACVAGAVFGIAFRMITGDREVPFGPFLSIGLLVMMLFGEHVVSALRAWPALVLGGR